MLKTDDGFELLPSIEKTNEEKDHQDEIMRRGNLIIKQYLARAKIAVKRRYGRTEFLRELWAVDKQGGPVVLYGMMPKQVAEFEKEHGCKPPVIVGISQTDMIAIRNIRAIEYEILCTYSGLIYQQSRRWNNRQHGSNMTFGDFYHEMIGAAIKAIYGFTKAEIKFITFLHVSMYRRVLNSTNECKPLTPWTQHDKKLYGQFQKISQELGAIANFDMVIEKMKCNQQEITALQKMFVGVSNQSEISSKKHEEFNILDSVLAPESTDHSVVMDHANLLGNIEMTDWERICFNAYLSGSRGWASEVARNNINPAVGKPYSRAAPKVVVDRVLARIRVDRKDAA